VERASRLRYRPAPGTARRRNCHRARNGQPGLGALVRHVRGAADGALRRPGPRAAARSADCNGGARGRDARIGPRARPRRRGRIARAGQARRPRRRVARGLPVPALGGPGGRRRARRLPRARHGYPGRRRDTLRARSIRLARAAAKRGGRKRQASRSVAKSQHVAGARTEHAPPRRPDYETELFFGRLRGTAKWVFAFLAVVFAGSFVFLGVGSGGSALTDFLNGNIHLFGGGGGPTAESVQKKVDKDPTNPTLRLQLAQLLAKDSRYEESITQY